MRITREALLKLSHDTAAERVRINRRIICVYLTGSLLHENPLLGGAGDIDLFLIHDSQPAAEREVVPLSEEIHLDIAHLSQDVFRQPRQMRTDPWISPFITTHPLVYHDTQHWFEFTQAAITSQFNTPTNVLQRARRLVEASRRDWLEAGAGPAYAGGSACSPQQVWKFLKAVEHAGNAIATLTGSPLAERRFLLDFPQRAMELGRPELSAGLLELVSPETVEEDAWQSWQPAWKDTLQSASRTVDCPPRLLPARLAYYQRAAAFLRDQHPAAALWILLRVWTLSACLLPGDDPHQQPWLNAIQSLSLDMAGFRQRIASLDGYLDSVEETLDDWARQMGA
ncbi:MAG TPA: hypothetical protein VMT46_04320 [Anaerolineaceae bacterium]|nr:hypothetical protein [Anaerolineaceae bacterium]